MLPILRAWLGPISRNGAPLLYASECAGDAIPSGGYVIRNLWNLTFERSKQRAQYRIALEI
jgi:hypothetical protein